MSELRRRLEILNGGPLQEAPRTPIIRPTVPVPARPQSPPGRSLEEIVPGTILDLDDGAACWLVERPARDVADWCPAMIERIERVFSSERLNTLAQAIQFRGALRLRDLLFLDLETTSLSGAPLFLIGTLQWEERGLIARQYLARGFEEEVAAIAAFAAAIPRFRAMVTFNGKSFDAPYLRQRASATGVRLRCPRAHLDLLIPARQRYSGSLPNCRLQTLEHHLCGRKREGDIPGRDIPAAYHQYVATGDATRIAVILEHNLLDLITMVDLLDRLV
ncbi:MAG TPA: ribonuclease H-like domain-containing protein [Armatimonadota bacterium]|nr:ribonuclease H-like domain-containing protein [Armatimonadota bacterium]